MRVCIVGHGPSMMGKRQGSLIEQHDKVVRLKGSNTVLGHPDYGSRTDALCASTEVMGVFFKMDAEEYWAYPKKGVYDQIVFLKTMEKLQKPVMLPIGICNFWNYRFRQMGAEHPNVSTGMAAIIIAIHRWKPKVINLVGFDTMMDPTQEFLRNDDIPRTGQGLINHDWAKEHDLLKVLRNVYKMSIESI